MKVRLTLEVDDALRRALRFEEGRKGLATRKEVRALVKFHALMGLGDSEGNFRICEPEEYKRLKTGVDPRQIPMFEERKA